MKNILITITFLISTFVAVPVAFGDDANSFELEGKLFSFSTTIPSGSSSALLAEVSAGQRLIVTQFCMSDFPQTELVGSKLGRVPSGMGGGCARYVAGVVFEGAQSVSCVSVFGPVFQDTVCLINGVVQSTDDG